MPAFHMNVQVRFRDIDALGHVNNAVFLSYCELARQRFFQEEFGVAHARDFEFILARAELDYLAALGMNTSEVRVALSVPRIGTSSWDFSYEISDPNGQTVFCRARTVQAYYDYAQAGTRPLPDEWRSRLGTLSP